MYPWLFIFSASKSRVCIKLTICNVNHVTKYTGKKQKKQCDFRELLFFFLFQEVDFDNFWNGFGVLQSELKISYFQKKYHNTYEVKE